VGSELGSFTAGILIVASGPPSARRGAAVRDHYGAHGRIGAPPQPGGYSRAASSRRTVAECSCGSWRHRRGLPLVKASRMEEPAVGGGHGPASGPDARPR
jgi:hypothetical protein